MVVVWRKFGSIQPAWLDFELHERPFLYEYWMIFLLTELSAWTKRYMHHFLSLVVTFPAVELQLFYVIVAKTGTGNNHHCQDVNFGEISTRCLRTTSSPLDLSLKFAQHKTLFLRIYRLMYSHYLPDTKPTYFAQSTRQVNFFLFARGQTVPLCTAPLFLHILVIVCELVWVLA